MGSTLHLEIPIVQRQLLDRTKQLAKLRLVCLVVAQHRVRFDPLELILDRTPKQSTRFLPWPSGGGREVGHSLKYVPSCGQLDSLAKCHDTCRVKLRHERGDNVRVDRLSTGDQHDILAA